VWANAPVEGLIGVAPLPAQVAPRRTLTRRAGSVVGRLLPGLVAAAAAAGLLGWGLGAAALWRDESATTVAIRRTWPDLWQLLQGSEAPLVPYYAVLKVLTGATAQLVPGSAIHLESFERWPSAAAMVIACWVLVHWATRAGSLAVAVSAGGLFLALSGLSRYGQEARPYAMVTALAVVSTVVWWRMVSGRPWVWSLPYALGISGMATLHTLAATLLAAHLVTAVIWRRPARGRLAGVLWTLGAGVAGLALAAPLTLVAVLNGTGAASDSPATGMLDAFLRLINLNAQPGPPVVVLMVMVLVVLPGTAILTRWRSDTQANLARLAAAWALIPVGLLTLASLVRPNLVATRYLLFTLPGWALLAGIGLAALGSGIGWAVAKAIAWCWRRALLPRTVTAITRAVTALVVAAAVAAAVVVQVPSLQGVRSPRGHGEDVRAVLAIADRPDLRAVPIQVLPAPEAIQVSAYAPGWAHRLINLEQQLTGPVIWPQRLDGAVISERLDSAQRVLILIRGNTGFKAPQPWEQCRIVARSTVDRRWSYVLLERAAAGLGEPGCPPAS
jgi:hypothetical protein